MFIIKCVTGVNTPVPIKYEAGLFLEPSEYFEKKKSLTHTENRTTDPAGSSESLYRLWEPSYQVQYKEINC
jgi:hypothetical protein